MIDISVRNLKKAFEVNNNILDGLSFEVNSGERVGLLGKNGAGKTTLFKILVGELTEDEGDVVIAKGKRIGLISQIPVYPDGYTTEDVLKTAHLRLYNMQERMEKLALTMAEDTSPEILKEYDELSAKFESQGGYDMDFERDRVANGLDIPSDMRSRLFANLSGGEKTRVNLARLILEDTDILLLDEPTNHLDLRATEWLEDYLLKFKGTVLAISHDRYFLDNIAQRTIEIVNGKAEFYSGNYSFYVTEKRRRYEEQLKAYEKEQKEIKRLDEAARRLYQWGTGNEKLMKKSFAIRSRIEHIQKTERPDKERKLKAQFAKREFFGDEVLVMEGVSKSFGNKELFNNLNLEITGGERIALIGDNGTGKSTLIKIIMQEEEPDDGFIYQGPSVKTAYLPQIIKFQDPERSLLDTLIFEDNATPQAARNRLGAFQFSGEDVFKPVSALSGGEQSRLRLCMLMKDEINFLILDEPTNHLDIASREWIEMALMNYDEALLFVSHDRYFIDKFATRIWELKDGHITDYKGTFSEYHEFCSRQEVVKKVIKKEAKKTQKKDKVQVSPEKQRARLEREIEKVEKKLEEITALEDEFASDYQKLLELGEEHSNLETQLNELYQQWGEVSDL